MKALAHLHKEPCPPPSWTRLFMQAAHDESLDRVAPSERARLVAAALVPESRSTERPSWIHRLAVVLDREPLRLYELEREVSPAGPIEAISEHWKERTERVMRGA